MKFKSSGRKYDGQTFGKLTVNRDAGRDKQRCILVECSCSCGGSITTRITRLLEGTTTSCGCVRNALARRPRNNDFRLTHGLTRRGQPRPAYLQIYYNAKARARRDKLPFDIDFTDIIIPDVCLVLGTPLVCGTRKASWDSPSLDKIIPELGYVKGNICVISRRANFLKSDATPDELARVAAYAKLHTEQVTNGKVQLDNKSK